MLLFIKSYFITSDKLYYGNIITELIAKCNENVNYSAIQLPSSSQVYRIFEIKYDYAIKTTLAIQMVTFIQKGNLQRIFSFFACNEYNPCHSYVESLVIRDFELGPYLRANRQSLFLISSISSSVKNFATPPSVHFVKIL